MSQKLNVISFFEQGVGGDMVFVVVSVDYGFYAFVFQEIGQLFGSVRRSAVYQKAVHQVSGDAGAGDKIRIAAQLNLGYLFIFGSGKHVLILSEESQHFF
jgi:hypothetical protein